MALGFGHLFHAHGQRTDHVVGDAVLDQGARQVHQAAAFGPHRQALVDAIGECFAQGPVGGQLGCVDFGKTASGVERVDVGQLRVRQGRDVAQVRAGPFKGGQVLRVIEGEGAVPEHADAHALFPDRRGRNDVGLQVRRVVGQRQQGGDVQVFGGHGGHALECFGHSGMFHRRDQAQMTAGQVLVGETRDGAEDGQAHVGLDGRANHLFLAARTHAIEDHAREPQLGVEHPATQDLGRHGAGRFGHVHDQYHRRADELRELGGGAGAAGVHAVEQSAVAFHDGDGRVASTLGEGGEDDRGLHHERIEIPTGRSGGGAEPGGVDEVGALLERGDFETALSERANQTKRHQTLAAIAGESREYQSWQPGPGHSTTPVLDRLDEPNP